MSKRFCFSVANGQKNQTDEPESALPGDPSSATSTNFAADNHSAANDDIPLSGVSLSGAPLSGGISELWQPTFFTPIHYTASYRYPLVVYLHGAGNNSRELGQVFRHVSLRNYVAVGVTGNRAIDQSGARFDWNLADGAVARASSAVELAVAAAQSRYNIHRDRVVLVGNGSGGTMALRIATESPQRYAAVVSIGGRMPKLNLPAWNSLRRRQLPMLWQWGINNPLYDSQTFEQDCKSALLCGAKVDVHQYPTEDEMDTVVLSDIDQWIMQRVVNGEPSSPAQTREVAYSLN